MLAQCKTHNCTHTHTHTHTRARTHPSEHLSFEPLTRAVHPPNAQDNERRERRTGVLMELENMVKAWVANRWVANGGQEIDKDRGAKLCISG